MRRYLWLHTRQNRYEAQLQAGLQQCRLVAFVDVCCFVQVVGQADAPGQVAVHQVQQQVHVGQRLDGHGGAVGGSAVDVGVDDRLAVDLGDFERQLEQVFQAQLVMVGRHQACQVLLGLFVLVVLIGALGQVEHRQGFAFFVLAGAVDDLVDVLERFLVRRQHHAEAFQVGDLTLVDLAVEQGQLMLEAVIVAADVAQGPGDVGDRRAACLGQGQGFFGAVRIGVHQQLQAALHVVFTVELGHAFEAYLGVKRLDLVVYPLQALPAVLVVVEQRQQVVHRVVDGFHEGCAVGQVGRQQLATTQGVFQGALFGLEVADLSADQLQLGRQLLDALGEGITGALEFVLGGFQLRQLLQLLGLFGGQGFAAAEIFQRLLRVQHLLVQGFGLRLGGGAVGGDRLLGLELFQLFFQALFLVAQGGAVGQGLQRRWINVGEVDGQPRRFEAFALEAVQYRFQRFYPQVAVVQFDATVAQRQAEQRTVEQAHQAVDVLLRELLAQAGVAVVVSVVQLLLDLLQAFFQVAYTLIQVFGGELARLCQGAGQFVVGILGRQQLLFQHLDVIDQGKAVLEHRQLAQPALDTGDFALQAHQLLSATALVVLQAVLLAAVVLGLDNQLFLARHGVFLPGAQQGIEHRRNAVQLAAQYVALGHTTGQGLDQGAGSHQGVVVLLHAAHVAEGFLTRGDIVDAARTQAVLEGVKEQLLELGCGDFAHVQQVDEQRAEGFQALLAGGAQRDHGQVQRHRGVAANQQAAQFVRLQLVGLDAQPFQVGEQLFLAQAGVVFLVVGQVQFTFVGKELVTEAAARAAANHADHVRAVGQAQLAENVRGIAGEVEAA